MALSNMLLSLPLTVSVFMLTLFITLAENIHIPIFLLFCLTETGKHK